MTSLDKIIGLMDYKTFAGPDWPSYQDLVSGRQAGNAEIQQEVTEFVRMMTQTYHETVQPGTVLAQHNQQRQRQVFFDKQLLSTRSCDIPWNTLGVNYNGDIFICSSPSWVPMFVGNLLEVYSVYDALNSVTAQQIRQEIKANRYFYCNNEICSFFKGIDPAEYQTHPGSVDPLTFEPASEFQVHQIPRNLIFDFDYTCNFQCASCRTHVINNNKHHMIRPINDSIVNRIQHMIIDQIQSQQVEIRWCGGEPFISEVYLNLMEYCVASGKNIQHIIQTNGSYLQKKADLFTKLLPTLKELRVSFDAATAATYAVTRTNGQWHTLLDNVRWARDTIRTQHAPTKLTADFVVQADNYQEIPAFVELCHSLEIDQINFQKMWNWGTWSQAEFDAKNIYNPQHSDYAKLVAVFEQAHVPIGY